MELNKADLHFNPCLHLVNQADLTRVSFVFLNREKSLEDFLDEYKVYHNLSISVTFSGFAGIAVQQGYFINNIKGIQDLVIKMNYSEVAKQWIINQWEQSFSITQFCNLIGRIEICSVARLLSDYLYFSYFISLTEEEVERMLQHRMFAVSFLHQVENVLQERQVNIIDRKSNNFMVFK